MAAFVEAQAELENGANGKKSKKKKKKKKKQVGDQLAELEQMMAQLEGGEGAEMDLDAAQAMLEGITETKKQKKKKIKKEKLPAPFEQPPPVDEGIFGFIY